MEKVKLKKVKIDKSTINSISIEEFTNKLAPIAAEELDKMIFEELKKHSLTLTPPKFEIRRVETRLIPIK